MISTVISPSGTEGSFIVDRVSDPRSSCPLPKTYSTLVDIGRWNDTLRCVSIGESWAANDERDMHSSTLPSEGLGKGISETAFSSAWSSPSYSYTVSITIIYISRGN